MRLARTLCSTVVLATAICAATGCSRGGPGSSAYQSIVAQVISGALKPDQYGTVKLPRGLASATTTGEVYVTTAPSGATLILFPTWQGKGANLQGYLYLSAPLAPGDTTTDAYGRTVIDLAGPVVFGPPPWPPMSHAERVIDKQLSPNWCAVYRDLD